MKNKRLLMIICFFLGILTCINLNTITLYASDMAIHYEIVDCSNRGDVIQTKYRMHNGKLQYRHWNVTQGCWVEDHWITIFSLNNITSI